MRVYTYCHDCKEYVWLTIGAGCDKCKKRKEKKDEEWKKIMEKEDDYNYRDNIAYDFYDDENYS